MGNQKSKISDDGFELKHTSGRTRLWLSKTGDIPITFHRDLPDDATIETVTVKRKPTGKWYAILGVETPHDPPEKPDEVTDAVGIDVGILKIRPRHRRNSRRVAGREPERSRRRPPGTRSIGRTDHCIVT